MHEVDRYAQRVVTGKVPAGTYHRLACARHLADRARDGSAKFRYRFDLAKAERFFRFAEKLKHYKGEWAGRFIVLEPHQKFRLGSVFGWVHVDSGLRRFRTAYNEVPRKNGKALAVDTPIATPAGWTRHGDLKVGDQVFGPDGQPKRVRWVSGPYAGPCYELTFSGGARIVAHAAHEWATERNWFTGRPKGPLGQRPLPLVETQRIAATLRQGGRGDFVHRIAVAAGFDLPEADLPVPPYTFGAWLGDGHANGGVITFADAAIADHIAAEGVMIRERSRKGLTVLYGLTDGDRRQAARNASIEHRLRRLGVLKNKHIPIAYLRASYRQRLEVLRGLVDTDGHCRARGIYEVVSVYPALAADIVALIHSLGLKATMSVDRARLNGEDYGPRYRILFSAGADQVAHLARKQTDWRPARKRRSTGRTIVAAEPCGYQVVNCIEVEGGFYLAGPDLITTHNSLEAAIVALYVAFFDFEPGAEGYCIATKREQAKIVFNDCKRLVQSSGLRSRIAVLTSNLHRDDTASKLEPLGADRDSTDGLNPNLIINDEFHAQKNRGMLDVMETATGARRQPLNFQITTAGSDPQTPCGDQHDYACKILDGVLTDDTFFAFVAHADLDDDWTAETTWRKANPNYGVSVLRDDLRALVTKARHMPPAAAAFKQKRLNLWVNADAPWLSLEGWRRGQHLDWTPESMRGRRCWIGVDMSSKIDLTAVALVFEPSELAPQWRILIHCLTPEDTLVERAHRDRAPYPLWVERGILRTNPGKRIDQDVVIEIVHEASALYDVQQVGVDPWNAGNLVKDLLDAGYQAVEIPQNLHQMSLPAKDFEADVLDGLIDAGGNPLMEWCVSNVVVQPDNKDNIYPVKKKSRGRIDPVIATLLARKLAGLDAAEPPAEDPDLVIA